MSLVLMFTGAVILTGLQVVVAPDHPSVAVIAGYFVGAAHMFVASRL